MVRITHVKVKPCNELCFGRVEFFFIIILALTGHCNTVQDHVVSNLIQMIQVEVR